MLIAGRTNGIRLDTILPGDKSIAHRAAIIASLATSRTVLKNFPKNADCQSTLDVLDSLGVSMGRAGEEITINGLGPSGFCKPAAELDCGNAGTTARLMAGLLAGQDFDCVLVGDSSLSLRPMGRVAEPLSRMGASIRLSGHETLPMEISGRRLTAIEFDLAVPSAQVKSAVLFAALLAKGETIVTDRHRTRDHTERLLSCSRREDRIFVKGGSSVSIEDMKIPGDLSSAAFLMAAAVLVPNSEVVIRDVSLNPTRTAFIEVLKTAGADIRLEKISEGVEPYGNIIVKYSHRGLRSVIVEGTDIPALIDELPVLAILGTQMKDGLVIRGARELRFKESDRISAIVKNLRAMKGDVEEFEDGFIVRPSRLKGSAIATGGDHRIAMAFAVAGMAADGETAIDNTDCVAISFPEFFELVGLVQADYA